MEHTLHLLDLDLKDVGELTLRNTVAEVVDMAGSASIRASPVAHHLSEQVLHRLRLHNLDTVAIFLYRRAVLGGILVDRHGGNRIVAEGLLCS